MSCLKFLQELAKSTCGSGVCGHSMLLEDMLEVSAGKYGELTGNFFVLPGSCIFFVLLFFFLGDVQSPALIAVHFDNLFYVTDFCFTLHSQSFLLFKVEV